MYSPRLLDHFQHPRNAGEIENPDGSVQLENPVCGDVLKLTLKIEDNRIADIRFLCKGCVPAMACGSALTELVKGKMIAEVLSLKLDDLANILGGLPQASTHAGHLAIDALAAVLKSERR